MSRMNDKLDKGYKMTNMSCETCNGVTMADASKEIKSLYCPKCD